MKISYVPEATPDGIKVTGRIIGYHSIISQLDSGKYDEKLPEGLRMLACIWEAKSTGWINLSLEKDVTIYRWLVVTLFINEERRKNGTIEITNDCGVSEFDVMYIGKHGGINISPAIERFVLARYVEGLAIEKYGHDVGIGLALSIYQDMVEISPCSGLQLSATGREGLEIMHDEFIKLLKTDGMPEMPVAH